MRKVANTEEYRRNRSAIGRIELETSHVDEIAEKRRVEAAPFLTECFRQSDVFVFERLPRRNFYGKIDGLFARVQAQLPHARAERRNASGEGGLNFTYNFVRD